MAGMTDRPAADKPRQQEHRLELRKEGLTTALYVSICLPALIALPEAAGDHVPFLGVIWGVTIGLTIAHRSVVSAVIVLVIAWPSPNSRTSWPVAERATGTRRGLLFVRVKLVQRGSRAVVRHAAFERVGQCLVHGTV